MNTNLHAAHYSLFSLAVSLRGVHPHVIDCLGTVDFSIEHKDESSACTTESCLVCSLRSARVS